MAARFPSDVSMPSFQASWQDGSDQGAFYWPYFYPWDGYRGYGYYHNFNFFKCYLLWSHSWLVHGGRLAIQNQFIVVMLKFL